MSRWIWPTLFSLGLLCLNPLRAGDQPERIRLYTNPDPDAKGGIIGRIAKPTQAIRQILAVPPDAPHLVYKASLDAGNPGSFRFTGLPMRRYDLVVIYDNKVFEGFQLTRSGDTLTDADRKAIETSIIKSEPYFPQKFIHRTGGVTGQGNTARAFCTYLREKHSAAFLVEDEDGDFVNEDPRRTFKLIMLKQVGPGWQIVRARDLYPIWTTPEHVRPNHHYSKALSRVRVTDYIKDLGSIELP